MNELENITVDKLYNDVADLIEKAKIQVVSHINTEGILEIE